MPANGTIRPRAQPHDRVRCPRLQYQREIVRVEEQPCRPVTKAPRASEASPVDEGDALTQHHLRSVPAHHLGGIVIEQIIGNFAQILG